MIIIGLAFTGIWLWWPLKIGWFRKGASFRRFNLDLHSVAGLYSSLFLLVIAGSGLTIHYAHAEHPPEPRVSPPAQPQNRITVDQAIELAAKAAPGTITRRSSRAVQIRSASPPSSAAASQNAPPMLRTIRRPHKRP